MDGQISTTSFIPKTRLAGPVQRGKGAGMGILISGFILFASLALFGGIYFYKGALQKEVNDMNSTLETAKKAFEPGLVDELGHLTGSINAAKTIIGQHDASSAILKLIGSLSLKDVVFSNFNYGFDKDGNAVILMSGEANGYAGVALQAKMLEDSEFIDNVVFSNLSLKDAGRVNFNVNLMVRKEFLIYKP